MMDALTSPSATATRPPASTNRPVPEEPKVGAGTKLSSDFETFLKMLTVQMQNQDPLSPVKSEDFAVQLATFSGVEQQVRTNDLLRTMADQRSLSGLAQVAGWIGMEAKAETSVVFDGKPVILHADLPTGADHATLVVRDGNGTVMARTAIAAKDGELTWSGRDQFGADLPPGTYDVRIESSGGGKPLEATTPAHYARITEARLTDGEAVLVFASGATLTATEVSAVRMPKTAGA